MVIIRAYKVLYITWGEERNPYKIPQTRHKKDEKKRRFFLGLLSGLVIGSTRLEASRTLLCNVFFSEGNMPHIAFFCDIS